MKSRKPGIILKNKSNKKIKNCHRGTQRSTELLREKQKEMHSPDSKMQKLTKMVVSVELHETSV
jgi:hypothetical protein